MNTENNVEMDLAGFATTFFSSGFRAVIHGLYDWELPPEQEWRQFIVTKSLAFCVGMGLLFIGMIILGFLLREPIIQFILSFD